MSKILARSPYWINATATDLINASIELWVYTGNRETARPDTPNYTITSTVTDTPNKVYWDISDLVKDFIVADKFDTSLDVVWVDYRITTVAETATVVGDTNWRLCCLWVFLLWRRL